MLRTLYSSRKMMMMALAASLLLVLGWFSAGTTFAFDPAGAHYAKPLTNDKWYEIEPGEVQWFAFEYEVRHEEVEGDDDDDEKEFKIERPRAFVWMNTTPSDDHINFAIWSPDRLQQLRHEMGDELEAPPLGRGNADDYTPGDYFWAGEYHENATIYVAVENKGTQTKYYSLHKEIEP